MATEDFSFPIIRDNYPYSIDSPPLWHLSPAASANSCHDQENDEEEEEEEGEEEEDCFAPKPIQNTQRRSFSNIKGGGKMLNDEKEDDEEEKMDMLWEDFNEELCTTSCSSRSNMSSSRDNMVELGCVKAMAATPKNPGTALSTRKPGMLVMVKVLKKLFLLQNSHRKHKRRGPHGHQ